MRSVPYGVVALLLSAVPVAAQTTIIYDSFSGPNGTTLTAHPPDTNLLGRPWTVPTGVTPTLQNGRLASMAASLALIDGGTPNAIVGISWQPGEAAELEAALVFRAVDAQNFFVWRMFQDRMQLYRVVDGQWTQLWVNNLEDDPRGRPHSLSVELSGANITVSWDSGVMIHTTSDYAHLNGRLYGIRWSGYETSSTYDAFSVWGLLPPPPTTVSVAPATSSIVFAGNTTLTATGRDAGGNPLTGLAFDWTTSNPLIAQVWPIGINTVLVTGTGTGAATITAIPVRGPVATATVTVTPGSTIVYDSFTDTNGTPLSSHSPEVNQMGQAWTNTGAGTPRIAGNRLTCGTGGSTVLIEGGTPNGTASVAWRVGTDPNPESGLIFRAVDANNYFVFWTWTDYLMLHRVVDGVWTRLWFHQLADRPEGNHSLQVELSGSSIRVLWDAGVEMFTTTDFFHINATGYGIRCFDTTSTYDNFGVYGTLPPPPTRVAVTPATNALVFNGQQTLTARGYDAGDVEIPGTTFRWSSSNPQVVSVGATSATTATITGVGLGAATITATPMRGPSGTATATVTPGLTIVYDHFTNGDGVPLATHRPVVDQMGGGWSAIGTLTPVVTGQRAGVTGTSGSALALIDAGTPNAAAAVTWFATTSPLLDGGLAFRATDANNLFLFRIYSDRLILYRIQNGQWTTLWSNSLEGRPDEGAHTMQVDLSGQTITLYWRSAIVFTTTDGFNANGTKYGLYWTQADTTSTYDHFRVTGTLAPPATRVVVTPASTTVPFHGNVVLNAVAYNAADQIIPGTNFMWSSSNVSAARVYAISASSALVTGMGEGASTITATAVRGPSATSSVTVNPGNTLVHDSFTGPDGTLLTARPLDVSQLGGRWTVSGGTPAVLRGNRMTAQAVGPGLMALVEGGAPDATVGATWHAGPGTYASGGIIARASDDQNYLIAYASHVYLMLQRVAWGNATTLASVRFDDDYFQGRSHRLELRVLGPAIEVWLNGEPQIQVTDSFNLGASKHGLRLWSQFDAVSTFDDFSVIGTLPPVVDTLAVSPTSLAIAPYESVMLTGTARDSGGQTIPGAVVAWSTSADSVARVNPTSYTTAVVQPMTEGTATITARVPRGIATDITIPVTVRVCVNPLASTSTTVPHNGGTVPVTVAAPTGCTWRAVPLVDWLTIRSGASGTGNGTSTIVVAANTGVATRTGHVAIGGRLFAVTQPPTPNSCVTGLSPGQTSFPSEGGTGDYGLVADPNCRWVQWSSAPTWLVPLEGTGQGSGSPRFRVLPNNSSRVRTAQIGVIGGGFDVTQAAGDGSGGDPPPPDWNTFIADVTFSAQRIGPGVPDTAGVRSTRFQWVRSSASGRWRTVLTFLDVSPTTVSTRGGPEVIDSLFGVSRMEDDEDASPIRFYDRQGNLIPPPTEDERRELGLGVLDESRAAPPATGPNWIDSIIVPLSQTETRRTRLAQQLGGIVGTVGGLDRYLQTRGSEQVEVLVDRASAVPVEINVVRDSTLVSHQTYSYTPVPEGKLLRTVIRMESLVPDDSGTRAVSMIEYSNVRFERR